MLSMIFFGLFHIAGGKKTQTAKEKQYIYISILHLNPQIYSRQDFMHWARGNSKRYAVTAEFCALTLTYTVHSTQEISTSGSIRQFLDNMYEQKLLPLAYL